MHGRGDAHKTNFLAISLNAYLSTGTLYKSSKEKLALYLITPDVSTKNLLLPVVPTVTGTAVAVNP